jgi:hypothetical protein
MSVKRGLSEQSRAVRLVPPYLFWLVPAVLAIVLGWTAWLTLACLIPGIAWYGLGEGARAYKDLRQADPNAPIGSYVPALSALSLFIVAVLFASRFAGLIIVGGFAYVDLVSLWKQTTRDRTSTVQR